MSRLLAHRGPDGQGTWQHASGRAGFAHRRLSIIDLSEHAAQPMTTQAGHTVTYNGEIYNYVELREEIGRAEFRTRSDTEVVLKAYERWGDECVSRLRGMFAFAIWDERNNSLFCARDRFGIKPFYYTVVGSTLYFASEIKALLPFVKDVATDLEGFKDYLTFQLCLGGKTLFEGVRELLPGCTLSIRNGTVEMKRYWEVYYEIDFDHTEKYVSRRLEELLEDSVRLHLRSDVALGAYVSGGLDSGVVAAMASRNAGADLLGFTGKFAIGPEYDESPYARALADQCSFPLYERNITADDFVNNISRVIYHLDYPVAGPGSFPQFMISELAAQHRKVVLGGQGGDEIFGGYARYLIAYFEQCIKAAIDGTSQNGNFVVTYESIIPNLISLQRYKPLVKEFFRQGMFDPMDQRYFRLINRAPHLGSEIRWEQLGAYSPYDTFKQVFNGNNVGSESYFDLMTHFDFKTLLPALLQVEDRVSMAHGLESRVPLLDHPLIEFAATIPADIKFKDGNMKHVFRETFSHLLPKAIVDRTDKMGFPTPFNSWITGEAREFVADIFNSKAAQSRDLVDNRSVLARTSTETEYGRNIWGLLCLELWQREFHDSAEKFRATLADAPSRELASGSSVGI